MPKPTHFCKACGPTTSKIDPECHGDDEPCGTWYICSQCLGDEIVNLQRVPWAMQWLADWREAVFVTLERYASDPSTPPRSRDARPEKES